MRALEKYVVPFFLSVRSALFSIYSVVHGVLLGWFIDVHLELSWLTDLSFEQPHKSVRHDAQNHS